MKILFVTPEFHGINRSGGLGTYVLNMSQALANRGHAVTVVTPGSNELSHLSINGVSIHAPMLPAYQGKAFFSGMRFLWRWRFDFPCTRKMLHVSREIHRYVKEHIDWKSFDVVHFSEYQGLGFFWALHKASVPYVVRLSTPTRYVNKLNGYSESLDLRLVHQIEMFAVRRCATVYSPTQTIMRYVSASIGRCNADGRVIHSPVDTAKFTPRSSRESFPKLILITGRVERRKGALLVADALPALFSADPDVQILWVGADTPTSQGKTSMVSWIKGRLSSQHLQRFEWRTSVPFEAMPRLYQECRMFWVPSIKDNLPNAALEAMASGCAIIASDQSGLEEIIQDGVNGLLFPSGDSSGLAEKTLRLLGDEERCRELGLAARSYALENLSLDVAAAKLEDLFNVNL